MKKTSILAASVYSLLLLGSTSVLAATEVWQMDGGAAGESVTELGNTFDATDLAKYLGSQSYNGASLELGKLIQEKYSGSWSINPITTNAKHFEAGESNLFDKKYADLHKEYDFLRNNGAAMDQAERMSRVEAATNQLAAFGAIEKYNVQKLIINAKYGIPLDEIDRLTKNLDTSSASLSANYQGKSTSLMMQDVISAALKMKDVEKTFNTAGMNLNSATTSLLQSNSLLSLQKSTLQGLANNTINMATNFSEAGIAMNVEGLLGTLKTSGIPQSQWQGIIEAQFYKNDALNGIQDQYKTLHDQASSIYGDTLKTMKTQYADLEGALDAEYLEMKQKVIDGLATNEDLHALMDDHKDLLATFENQIDLAEFNYEAIDEGLMTVLSSKGLEDSAFFTGDTSFSGKSTTNMSNFYGGGGGTNFAGLSGGGGGGKSGGGGTAPLVNH